MASLRYFKLASLLYLCVSFVNSLDTNTIREEACLQPPVDSSFDGAWAASVPVWYSTLFNKAEIYRMTQKLIPEQFKTMKEPELKNACMYYTFSLDTSRTPVYGYNTVYNFEVYLNPLRPGVVDWATEANKNGQQKYLATSYITLSDNKNAFVIVTIWNDGLKGFSIASKDKTIPASFLKKAKNHIVKDLGFNPELFYETSYENCKPFGSFNQEL